MALVMGGVALLQVLPPAPCYSYSLSPSHSPLSTGAASQMLDSTAETDPAIGHGAGAAVARVLAVGRCWFTARLLTASRPYQC